MLRPFAAADLPALVAYRSDPQVAAYQSWDADYAVEDAERFLAEQRGLELGLPGAWVQLVRGEGSPPRRCRACSRRSS